MPSMYAVVQITPDPLAEEKMNIGVVAWDDTGAQARFVESWARLTRFAGPQLRIAKDFAENFVRELVEDGDPATIAHQLERIAADLTHTIQLTPPRGSTQPASELLDRLVARYLPEAPKLRKRARGRRSAAADAHRVLRKAVEIELPNRVAELVHSKHIIAGQLQDHQFDVVLANGRTVAAIDGLSFAVSSKISLQRDVDVIAWALDDVRKRAPSLPLAVYAIRPTTSAGRSVLETARRTYAGLDAKLIETPTDLKAWSKDQVVQLAGATERMRPVLERV